MATPAIQTLITDAQQVLNLKSLSEIRATLTAVLANANVGTPLNPNLTTQQLWDEFYQIVRQTPTDIESILVNQMMKFVFSPPAPGGAGANTQVIFNDGGALAGDAGLTYNKTTDALTITGDLTVRTNKLFVNSVGVGIGAVATSYQCEINSGASASTSQFKSTGVSVISRFADGTGETGYIGSGISLISGISRTDFGIASNGALVFGVSTGLAMTLNANGLGVGVTPYVSWPATSKALQLGASSAIEGRTNDGSRTSLYTNAVWNGTDLIYQNTAAASYYQQALGVHSWHTNSNTPSAGNPATFTQAMTLDASGRLLVGSTSAFTDLTGSKEVKVGDSGMQTLTVASLPASTATNIARGGVGGLVYVGGFNGTGQYGAVVLWTAASATVVSVINGTGSTITFGVASGFLQITSSLVLTQVTASCIRI